MPDIPVWHKCDNRCVMCTNGPEFARQEASQYGLRCQVGKLERYLSGRYGKVYLKNPDKPFFVSLTGGEPTMHPEFIKLLAYFRRRLPGTRLTLLTNGRRLGDKAFARRVMAVAAPPFSLGVPVHGPDARTHDAVAGVRGAFRQTMAGLRNFMGLRAGQELEIRVVLHRLNIKKLGPLLGLLLREFPDTAGYRVVLIHYEIEGMSSANNKKLSLRLSDSAEAIARLRPLLARFAELRLYHFPRCVLPADLRGLCWVTLPEEDRLYPPGACWGCALRRGCAGLMKDYAAVYGTGELRKVRR
ncbi:MAG: radical SAM protein [Elusimicrobiota bacterium]